MKNFLKKIEIGLAIIMVGFWFALTVGLMVRNAELQTQLYGTTKNLAEADMIALINGEREKAGIPVLKENAILDKTATLKACDMDKNLYFDHLDLSGQKSWHLFLENGYKYHFAGENLVEGYLGDQESMRRLMNSPSHRENILDPDFTDVGIGKCGIYTVQHFASPL